MFHKIEAINFLVKHHTELIENLRINVWFQFGDLRKLKGAKKDFDIAEKKTERLKLR